MSAAINLATIAGPRWTCGTTNVTSKASPIIEGPSDCHHPQGPLDLPKENTIVKIFFDYECMQEGGDAHCVNLVCVETSLNDQRSQFPSIQEFMAFQGYDGYLLLEELYKQAVVPSQMVNGAKLLSVSIPGGIKFIDSLNFFPMALASFPQTFGLQEKAKGFFPHFFNVPTLQQYMGAMPDKHYYVPPVPRQQTRHPSYPPLVQRRHANTNIFVAAFTTAHARVKLYRDGLHPLLTRVLYMDTDSVVYLATQGETHLPRGRFLGQFKDELKGDVIDKFVAGGPKHYAYRTHLGQECWKVRGFTLNARGQAILNFESVRNLVRKDIDEPLDHPRTLAVDKPHHIVWNITDKTLHSVLQWKTYSMVQDKRVLDARTGMTYPYGYQPT